MVTNPISPIGSAMTRSLGRARERNASAIGWNVRNSFWARPR